MNKTLALALLMLAAPAAADEQSTAAAFMECARLADDARRLACYDRLATDLIELGLSRQSAAAAETPTPSPEAAAAAPAATAAAARPAPPPPAAPPSAPAPQPATAASAPVTTAAAPSQAEADFGSERLDGGKGSDVDEIRSRYVGEFTGWDGKTIFRLENGQVWQQTRSGRLAWRADSPMITIKRGMLGGYRLSVEGVNKQVYVKRIQ